MVPLHTDDPLPVAPMRRHAFAADQTGFPGCAEHIVRAGRGATCDAPPWDPIHFQPDDPEVSG